MKKAIRSARFWYTLSGILAVLAVVPFLAGCGVLTWLTDAQTILPVVLQSALGILSLVAALTGKTLSASESAAINKFATDVQNAITAIDAMVEQYQSAASASVLANIEAAVKALQTNISQFLSAISIKDPATQAKIEDVVTLIADAIDSWASLLPALSATATATVAANTVTVKRDTFTVKTPLSKKAYKTAYNQILTIPSGSPQVDAALATLKKL